MRLITPKLWNFQRVLHTLAATQEVPRHTRLHSRGSTRVPPTTRGAPFPHPSSRGGFLSLRGRERIPGVPSHLKRRRSPQERGEELHGHASIPRVPQKFQSIPGKPDTAASAHEEFAHAYPHSRRGLTPLWRLQKYPKIHVSTGQESSGSGTDSTQGFRPQHRREQKPERSPSNSQGDWPFLRPPERVPDVPVVSREHLPQLEKIQEVLPSRRDEAHFR